jgi:hypothetical protein
LCRKTLLLKRNCSSVVRHRHVQAVWLMLLKQLRSLQYLSAHVLRDYCHTQLSWRQALKVLELEQHAEVELSKLSFHMLGVCLKHSNHDQLLATSLPFTHCSGLAVHPDNASDV